MTKRKRRGLGQIRRGRKFERKHPRRDGKQVVGTLVTGIVRRETGIRFIEGKKAPRRIVKRPYVTIRYTGETGTTYSHITRSQLRQNWKRLKHRKK